jgi:hypothetical protein
MAVNDDTWAEIERAYTTTHDSEVEIARRYGLHHFAVFQRAKARRWARPVLPKEVTPAGSECDGPIATASKLAARPGKVAKPGTKRNLLPSARVARDKLITRLYGAIATKLTKLEERMAEGQPTMTPEESERHTREIGSMIQGFEKVTEVATDAAKTDAAIRPLQPVVTTLADIERVRRELAERLHRAWGRKNG